MRKKVILVVALILGLLLAFIDSRPNWDDTGIIAFAILISGGVIGCSSSDTPGCLRWRSVCGFLSGV